MRRWVGRGGALALLLAACGGVEPAPVSGTPATDESTPIARAEPAAPEASGPAEGDPPPTAPAPPESRWTEACETEYRAILTAVEQSQERPCRSEDECVTVTHPGHPTRELLLVAHRSDAADLEARAGAHLSTCGASVQHHVLEEAFDHVEARCRVGCRAEVTACHPEPLD